MGAIAPQITSTTIVYSTVYSDADQRKHQSSASLALCGEFTGPRWMASNAENVSIWWRHHESWRIWAKYGMKQQSTNKLDCLAYFVECILYVWQNITLGINRTDSCHIFFIIYGYPLAQHTVYFQIIMHTVRALSCFVVACYRSIFFHILQDYFSGTTRTVVWMSPGQKHLTTSLIWKYGALKFSLLNRLLHIFQCMGKIVCL